MFDNIFWISNQQIWPPPQKKNIYISPFIYLFESFSYIDSHILLGKIKIDIYIHNKYPQILPFLLIKWVWAGYNVYWLITDPLFFVTLRSIGGRAWSLCPPPFTSAQKWLFPFLYIPGGPPKRNSRYCRFSGLCSDQQLFFFSPCWIEHLSLIIW